MMQQTGASRAGTEDYVAFWSTGDVAKGEFHCSECGYGVTIARELPTCPMCGGTSWEQTRGRGSRRLHRSV
jgi:rubrerythrin